ncbi:high-affinity branched-chain amino acid transport system permease protein [Lacticaseibacillus casei UW4]|nr:high-affinity branched-chain amino acid transport system permease protein [Lacticaseibacillus casei UW4]
MQLLILFTSLVLMVMLQFIIKQTTMGKAMRAVAVDPEAAQLVGINPDHVISFTFALGSALAGAAGVMIGLYYNSIDPLMGMVPGIKAFVAAVVGGIGSVPGAAVGGFLIGLLETGVHAVGLSAYKDAAVYLVLIIMLVVLPAGLFGKRQREKV